MKLSGISTAFRWEILPALNSMDLSYTEIILFDRSHICELLEILFESCVSWQSACSGAVVWWSLPRGDYYKYHPCEGGELLSPADGVVSSESSGRNYLACLRWLFCAEHVPLTIASIFRTFRLQWIGFSFVAAFERKLPSGSFRLALEWSARFSQFCRILISLFINRSTRCAPVYYSGFSTVYRLHTTLTCCEFFGGRQNDMKVF